MISIIMIAFNVEPYVRQAIESVLAQTYRDFELIIVASPGKDKTVDICGEYAQKDQRIKLITCPPKGEPDARNHGLKAVTGDYLGFVDSDDYVEPDMFERMLGNMEKYDADIAVCGRFFEYKNGTLKDAAKDPVVMTPSEAIATTLGHDGFFLHCWDKLFSKKIFTGLVFRPDMPVEDRIVVDTLLAKADRIVYDSTPMYHFRERSGSGSKRREGVRKNVEANRLMEEFVKGSHPELSDRCDAFMLYEYITAIQNELVMEDTNKDDVKEFTKDVKRLLRTRNPYVNKTLKIKALMAVYSPLILKMYTVRRQANVAAKLERFS